MFVEIPWRQFPEIMLFGDEYAYEAGNALADLLLKVGADFPPDHDPYDPDSPMADYFAISFARAKGIGFIGAQWTQWSE